MGLAIPQVITPSKASGAQVIDGSLKFDGSNSNRLTRTFGSAGDRTSWTWSCWAKRDKLTSNRQVIFGGYSASNNTDWLEIGWDNGADHVYWTSNGVTSDGTAQRRDPTSWYHFFSTYDGSNLRIYVNNHLDLDYSVTGNMGINVAGAHYIGQTPKNAEDRHLYGRLSQCYFIDGQVLNPSDFAFTDPLTGTWRPKKFSGNFTVSNPNAINDGTNWNSYFTGDYDQNHGWGTTYQSSNAFDGNLTTVTMGQANSTGLTWTPPGGAIGADATTIRIYGNDDNCPDDYLKINGINYGGLILKVLQEHIRY